jgi:hypothetical protein
LRHVFGAVVIDNAVDADVSVTAVVSRLFDSCTSRIASRAWCAREDCFIGALSNAGIATLAIDGAVGVIGALNACSHGVIGAEGGRWIVTSDGPIARIDCRGRDALIRLLGARVDTIDIAKRFIALVVATEVSTGQRVVVAWHAAGG